MTDSRIEQANGRLRAAKMGVVIEASGNRLYLRATFPPKPGSKKDRPYQQRLALRIYANPAGIKEAENEARSIGALLARKTFQWEPYLRPSVQIPQAIGEWVDRLKQSHFHEGKSQTSWSGDYWKIYKDLPLDQPISADLLEQRILATKPNTRTRKRACMAIGRLAKFASLDFDPAPLAGNYSPSRVSPRDLPDDRLIAEWFYAIKNPRWRWVYGVMATYGLRNHEVFRLDWQELKLGNPILKVGEETKTGEREVWPCYPEWVEQFKVFEVQLPKIALESRTNMQLGKAVTRHLSPRLPFCPYDLRHCWAIRTLEFGWPTELSAQQMGHSVALHNATYHRWITKRHHQRMYDLLVMRSDRPKAPNLSFPGEPLEPAGVLQHSNGSYVV